jgi:hypothetical protein
VKRRLTTNQRAVLQAIHDCVAKNRVGPNTREIFDVTGLYPGVIVSTIAALEKHKLAERSAAECYSFRSLRLTTEGFKVLGVDNPDTLLARIVAAWDGKTERSKARFIELMNEARKRSR